MQSSSESMLQELKVVLESLALQILRIAIPAHDDVWMSGNLHNGRDDRWRCTLTMDFEPNLLATIGTERSEFVQRRADLFNRLFSWHVVRKIVRLDLYTTAAD